jgi:hypothetical protein
MDFSTLTGLKSLTKFYRLIASFAPVKANPAL